MECFEGVCWRRKCDNCELRYRGCRCYYLEANKYHMHICTPCAHFDGQGVREIMHKFRVENKKPVI
jgi:hypothetical protein